MSPKAQHTPAYQNLRSLLRLLREESGLTQRELGRKLRRPQSWVYNCETGNRRIDVTEFIAWCKACDSDPRDGFARILRSLS